MKSRKNKGKSFPGERLRPGFVDGQPNGHHSCQMRGAAWLGLVGLVGTFALANSASADTLGALTEPFSAALRDGSYSGALGLIFLAGLATSLTPCV
mgnify:CR=1 FL=1